MRFERSCGILLHISSLPGRYGTGTLGPEAYEFAELLARRRPELLAGAAHRPGCAGPGLLALCFDLDICRQPAFYKP